jgi:uncharacterized protein (DUF849 family)
VDIDKVYKLEHEYLIRGSKAISEYLNDDRFLILPKAHEMAYKNLENMKEEFECFKEGWFDFIRRIG